MKLFTIAMLIGFGLQNIPGCGVSKSNKSAGEASRPADESQSKLQKVYVETALGAPAATAGEEITLHVSGNLPSPAYKLERVEVQIKDNVVELTPLASFDRGKLAAQVLVPFSEPVKLKLPAAGEYTIRVVGRTENRESKITIQ